MKKLIYSLLMGCSLLGFASCEDETSQDPSVITYYATLSLQGDSFLFWEAGKPWVDPGYSSEMQGEDVTDQVKADVPNVNRPGVYDLNYLITNADGFSSSDSRRVVIYNGDDSKITASYWTVDLANSYRINGGTKAAFKGAFTGYVMALGNGDYHVSDLLGGWYEQGAGYGEAYAMKGVIHINADNTITPVSGDVAGWGDSMDGMDGAVYDPVARTISYTVYYAGSFEFHVVLKLND